MEHTSVIIFRNKILLKLDKMFIYKNVIMIEIFFIFKVFKRLDYGILKKYPNKINRKYKRKLSNFQNLFACRSCYD